MPRQTSEWLLFLFCLALGVAGGLAWAWLVAPARPNDTTPAALNGFDRAIYLHLVADNFAADGDRTRAAVRLEALGADGVAHLVALLGEELRAGRGGSDTLRLAVLAAALHVDAPEVALLAPPLALPAATPPPAALDTTSTIGPPTGLYELIRQEPLCVPGQATRGILVTVNDSLDAPLANIPITVNWDEGQNTFYTGFAGDGNIGTADFDMTAGQSYSLRVGDDAPAVAGLAAQTCPDGQEGGWQLVFRERAP